MLAFRHTAHTSNGLDIETLRTTFTQLHKDFSARAVPACCDCLFEQQKRILTVQLFYFIRIVGMISRKPRSHKPGCGGIFQVIECLFHTFNPLVIAVRELYQNERSDFQPTAVILRLYFFPLFIRKIEQESPNLLDLILGHKIDVVIDTPPQGVEHQKDGFVIRRNAIETGVNVLTSLDTAEALVTSLENTDLNHLTLIDIATIADR